MKAGSIHIVRNDDGFVIDNGEMLYEVRTADGVGMMIEEAIWPMLGPALASPEVDIITIDVKTNEK